MPAWVSRIDLGSGFFLRVNDGPWSANRNRSYFIADIDISNWLPWVLQALGIWFQPFVFNRPLREPACCSGSPAAHGSAYTITSGLTQISMPGNSTR
jgi:hypothetical protein